MLQLGTFLVAVATVAWLAVLGWRMGTATRPRPIVLAMLPIGLLFLTIPPVVAAIGMISGFRRIGTEGRGGVGAVAPFLSSFSRALAWGGFGLVLTMVAAVGLQAWGSWNSADDDAPEPPSDVHTWILVLASLLFVPVAYYSYDAGRLPGLVTDVATRLQHDVRVEASEVAESSRTIASALVRTVISGSVLTLVLAACGIAGLIAAKRGKSPHWLFTYSWIVLAAAAALAAWSILHASTDLLVLERLIQ